MTEKKYTLNIEMPNTFGICVYCDQMSLTEELESDDTTVKKIDGFIEGRKVFTLRAKKGSENKVDIKVDGI